MKDYICAFVGVLVEYTPLRIVGIYTTELYGNVILTK